MISPEFRKNCWLELSEHRIIATPIILGTLFYLFSHFTTSSNQLMLIALWFFWGLTGIYGTKQAGDSVIEEIRNNTWTLQRTTAISPWAMTWGKWLGSAIFSWYAGLWVFGIFFSIYVFIPSTPTHWSLMSYGIPVTVAILFGVPLLFQGLSLLFSLIGIQKTFIPPQRRAFLSTLAFFIAVSFAIWLATRNPSLIPNINWYNQYIPITLFSLSILYSFLVWTGIGNYLLMRRTLQLRNLPICWLLFLVFLVFLLLGFRVEALQDLPFVKKGFPAKLGAVWSLFFAMSYIMVFTEYSSCLNFRKLYDTAKRKKFRSLFEDIPRWAITVSVNIIIAILLILQLNQVDPVPWPKNFSPMILIVSLMAFMFRDLGLVTYFQIQKNPMRSTITAIIYLGIFYWLVPALMNIIGLGMLKPILVPTGSSNIIYATVPGLIQAGLIWWVIVRQCKGRAPKTEKIKATAKSNS